MSETFPKATEVRMAANLLAITFDNGQTRYMRSHFMNVPICSLIRRGHGKAQMQKFLKTAP